MLSIQNILAKILKLILFGAGTSEVLPMATLCVSYHCTNVTHHFAFFQYEAIVGSVDFQFHSCQEPRVQRDPTAPPQEEVSEPNPPQHPQQDTVAVAAATNQHNIASSSPQGASCQQNNHFDRPPPRGEVVPVQKRVSMAF